ncbi:hypothetical protein [Demequina iriomotensis]|uniref:hypothetical protein n=1 Tax=Demequina iriomotensis TaxID=1536641 RepID=UPI000783A7C3|nr:hypothetical protein [Demequina iriomotensis]
MRTRAAARRATAVAVAVAAATGIAACGGGEAPPSVDQVVSEDSSPSSGGGASDDAPASGGDTAASGDRDVCALVSPADLEEITGLTFEEGVFDTDLSSDAQLVCNWTHGGDQLAIVQVLVLPDVGDVVRSQRDTAEEWMGATTDVEVAGAADAYALASGSILGMRVGQDFVQVSYMEASGDDVTGTTVAIAEAAIGNL